MNRMATVQGRDPRARIGAALTEGAAVTAMSDPTSPNASYLSKAAYAQGSGKTDEATYYLLLAAVGAITGMTDEMRRLREAVERLDLNPTPEPSE